MATMPKRNKSKDNPYTLGYNEVTKIYTVSFIDNKKVIQNIEITEEVYKAFDKFELEDISQIHKYRRHIEHSEIYEETLNSRSVSKTMNVNEIVEKNILLEEVKKSIDKLPNIQRRRLKKYFFENKTYELIAKEEHCTKRAVKFSIDIAIEKISQNFKN